MIELFFFVLYMHGLYIYRNVNILIGDSSINHKLSSIDISILINFSLF